MTNANGIYTECLTKNYGDLCAVNAINLDSNNEIYGLLGPNGSGKTTTVRMLTTLLSPTSGRAEICGYDITDSPAEVRKCISYVPQDMAVDIRLTGRENVDFFAKLYGIDDVSERRRRIEEVLDIMNLSDRADDLTKTYSGGMKRRLELSQALVHEPLVLFLDEPTVGLDVAARRSIWEHITKLRRSGMTILVTTHQMDEAERYCNRVGIIKKGSVIKEGRPDELKSALMKDVIVIHSTGGLPKVLPDGASLISANEEEYTFSALTGSEMLPELIREFEASGIHVLSSSVRRPTLEDVYLQSCGSDLPDNTPFDYRQFRNLMYRR